MELYRTEQFLAIECHTIQLPQFRDCMTYSVFRCTISEVNFTLTSRDLLIHRSHAEVLTYTLVYVCSTTQQLLPTLHGTTVSDTKKAPIQKLLHFLNGARVLNKNFLGY